MKKRFSTSATSVAAVLVIAALVCVGCTSQPTPTVTVTTSPSPSPEIEEDEPEPFPEGEWDNVPAGWDTTIDDSDGEVLLKSIMGGMAVYERLNDSAQRSELVVAMPDEDRGGENMPSTETVRISLGSGEMLEWAYTSNGVGTVFGVYNERDPEFFEIRFWASWNEEDTPRVVWTPSKGDGRSGREAAFKDSLLIFNTSTDGKHCLTSMQFGLETPPEELIDTVVCSKTTLWWPRFAPDYTLSYLQSDNVNNCSQLFRLTWPFKKPKKVQLPGCVGRAQAGEKTAVWSELPVPDGTGTVNWFDVPIRAMRADGTIDDLGRGAAGTERMCGSGAIWSTEGASDPLHSAIRQWKPDGMVGTLYQTELAPDAEEPTDSQYYLYGLNCFEDRVSFGRGDIWTADDRDVYLYSPALESVWD